VTCRELPPQMTIEELRDFLWADTDEQQAGLLERSTSGCSGRSQKRHAASAVRVMSMHGAKGLSARVVSSGARRGILPGPTSSYPGWSWRRLASVRVHHEARAACVISYAVNEWCTAASSSGTVALRCSTDWSVRAKNADSMPVKCSASSRSLLDCRRVAWPAGAVLASSASHARRLTAVDGQAVQPGAAGPEARIPGRRNVRAYV